MLVLIYKNNLDHLLIVEYFKYFERLSKKMRIFALSYRLNRLYWQTY